MQLPVEHPVRQMHGIARAIALPGEETPVRFPSFPALERTATIAFNQPTTYPIDGTTGTAPVGGWHMMLARQACYPLWTESTVANYSGVSGGGSQTVSYTATFGTNMVPSAGAADAFSGTVSNNITWWSTGNYPALLYSPGISNTVAVPTGYPILGRDGLTGPRPWFFWPKNTSLSVLMHNITGSAPTLTVLATVSLEVWDNPGECHEAIEFEISGNWPVGATGLNSTLLPFRTTSRFSAASGLWVRPCNSSFSSAGTGVIDIFTRITLAVGVGTTFNYTPSAANNAGIYTPGPVPSGNVFMPSVGPSEFANSSLPWLSARVTASAVLGTNVSQVLSKSGTILCGRLAPEQKSPWAITSSDIVALHPAEKAWIGMETGVYTYAPPSTDLVNFWDYTLNSGGTDNNTNTPVPMYRLDNTSLVNHMYFTGATGIVETLAITVSWHMEFRTSSALFDIGLSTVQLETLHQAQMALVRAGFFFDNPHHSAILGKVATAVNALAKTLLAPVVPPLALGALSAVNPTLGAAANTAYNAVRLGKAAKQVYQSMKAATPRLEMPVVAMNPTSVRESILPGSARSVIIQAPQKKKKKAKAKKKK